jgi:hypothetical protein
MTNDENPKVFRFVIPASSFVRHSDFGIPISAFGFQRPGLTVIS